jgi:hypothetical protein
LNQVFTLALAGTVICDVGLPVSRNGRLRLLLAASVMPFLVALLRYGLLRSQGRGERPERLMVGDRDPAGHGHHLDLMVWGSLYVA